MINIKKSGYTNKNLKILKPVMDLEWGFGIEHEMQLFHVPDYFNLPDKNIQDFILFDSKSATKRLLKSYEKGEVDLTNDEFDYLKKMTFETSGRVCNGQFIVKQAPYEMPEFITWKPFCNLKNGRKIPNLTHNIIEAKDIFLNLLKKDKTTQKLIKKYGPIEQYPFGMTRYMTVPKKILKDKYILSFNKQTKKPFIRNDYTGSYHITFTLPHNEETTLKKFIQQHQNFGNQLQWLEPLMLIGFFSGDEYAVGSKEKRVRGSYRVLNIGWGNLAGSDIRLFGTKGIGRYAKTPNYWRKGLNLYEVEKLKPCIPASPSAIKELGISSLSSDLRTFGDDPENPGQRISGAPMTKPNGIEFRIFDQFDDKFIKHLTFFVGMIAENSRKFKTKGYVYEDKDWIEALHEIMKDGYKSIIPLKYIKKLRSKLGLKIKTKSQFGQDVFNAVYTEMFMKNMDGEWPKLFFGIKDGKKKVLEIKDSIPEINKRSWIFAFMLKCHRNPEIFHNFNQLNVLLNQLFKTKEQITFEEMKEYVNKIIGDNWTSNTIDLIYFYQYYDFLDIEKNEFGEIISISKSADYYVKDIPIFHSFNEYISEMCSY